MHNNSLPGHSLAELLKMVATTMGKEGLTSLVITSDGTTGAELSELLEHAFLGEDFTEVLKVPAMLL